MPRPVRSTRSAVAAATQTHTALAQATRVLRLQGRTRHHAAARREVREHCRTNDSACTETNLLGA